MEALDMDWLKIAVLVCVFFTLVVLFIGIGGFAGGGEFNRRHGNRIMRFRVGFQLAALVLLAIMFLVMQGE